MERPTWAKALIVAILEEDRSEIQSDYFNSVGVRTVALAWSKHERDLFAEMRKAAATFPETMHLGPDCGRFEAHVVHLDATPAPPYFGIGDISRSHPENRDERGNWPVFPYRSQADAFVAAQGPPDSPILYDGVVPVRFAWEVVGSTQAIEHREKWSMGAGYYLKGTGRYTTGWKVTKVSGEYHWGRLDEYEVGPALLAPPVVAQPQSEPAPAGETIVRASGKRPGYVEIVFPGKPDDATRAELKASGFRWARFARCWYGPKAQLPERYLSEAEIAEEKSIREGEAEMQEGRR